ncbi:MAG: acylphosphatase [Anaerolineae bacterium]|jgi:acylphosphatase
MKRLIAVISGRVQGVSFRYYTQQAANELHLSGWVANLPDGTVKVVAEGPEERLHKLIDKLRQGPPSSRVDAVTIDWQEAGQEFTRFSIRWFSR